jgi:hypothetical protein
MDYEEYERRKKALPADLTPEEYTAAIRRICDELEGCCYRCIRCGRCIRDGRYFCCWFVAGIPISVATVA